jgi:hypothetical protein
MFGRLRDWRRVATRYDRCPTVFFSAIALAAIIIFWLGSTFLTLGKGGSLAAHCGRGEFARSATLRQTLRPLGPPQKQTRRLLRPPETETGCWLIRSPRP